MGTVIAGLLGWQAYRNWAQLESDLAAIRAQGLPVTLSELNSFYNVEKDAIDSSEEWMMAIANLRSVINKGKDLQIVGVAKGPIPPPGEEWVELAATRKFLEQISAEVAQVHLAAAKGGQIRFSTDFRAGMATTLNDTQDTRSCARILTLAAHVHAYDGDYAAVQQNIRHIFALSDAMRREPCLVSCLVRIAIHSIACHLIEDMLPYADWNDEQLAALQSSVTAADFQHDLIRALHGERALALDVCEKTVFWPFRRANVAMFLELYEEWITGLQQDWVTALEVGNVIDARLGALASGTLSKLQYMGVLNFAPAIRNCFEAGTRATTNQSAITCLLAMQRFRLTQKSLPATLAELSPKYLNQVPLDPFNNTPLKYLKKSETSARIYSVYQNRVDDQADYTRDRPKKDCGVFYEKRPWPVVED